VFVADETHPLDAYGPLHRNRGRCGKQNQDMFVDGTESFLRERRRRGGHRWLLFEYMPREAGDYPSDYQRSEYHDDANGCQFQGFAHYFRHAAGTSGAID
jgi:hypothetical protein